MRSSAKAAIASSPANTLASTAGVPFARPDMLDAEIQLERFRGHAFSAVNAIAKRCAGQEVFVARKSAAKLARSKSAPASLVRKSYLDDLVPIRHHRLLSLLDKPNELMTRWHLIYNTIASLEITGRAYWWLWQTDSGMQLWPIPPSWMQPQDLLGKSYKVRPIGVPIESFDLPGDQVCYFHLPNPANPFCSKSPMQAQADTVYADEAMQTAQAERLQ